MAGNVLHECSIGTGGWTYFHIPGLRSLVAYSRAFDFVEVNSTFYHIPELREVENWRKLVPPDFQFSVRANRTITHKNRFEPIEETFKAFEKMKRVCEMLKADVMHLLTPASLRLTSNTLSSFLQSTCTGNIRIALELRGMSASKLPPDLIRTMEDNDIIHSVDLSKGEIPAYQSDILYTRLFGRGERNQYEPNDEELAEIDKVATQINSTKIKMSFHFVKMYKDAARLKIYKQTGKFPSITRARGLWSLEQVLREDAVFPATKQQLVKKQGWKLFDADENTRPKAEDALQRLPERTYYSIDDVMMTLRN
jgi:uncharacterized protein YecE (DUF72 family)